MIPRWHLGLKIRLSFWRILIGAMELGASLKCSGGHKASTFQLFKAFWGSIWGSIIFSRMCCSDYHAVSLSYQGRHQFVHLSMRTLCCTWTVPKGTEFVLMHSKPFCSLWFLLVHLKNIFFYHNYCNSYILLKVLKCSLITLPEKNVAYCDVMVATLIIIFGLLELWNWCHELNCKWPGCHILYLILIFFWWINLILYAIYSLGFFV